uniref:Serine hydrolase domain-containing protein n=1 Tax=Vitrella brassicaformis TaxID=1169539 RepID=A0A7S1NYE3_9ALVE|mmetsp:Transcript_154/g.411  ORF Transcript_154/g.411 Transcript_154/m.411 type:complete len:229 (+) Transcript_154:49-735(+)
MRTQTNAQGRRLKILCLPGWRTNSRILRDQLLLSGLTHLLADIAELKCLDPCQPAQGPTNPIVKAAWPDETDFYQWWYTNENTMEYDAGEAAVDYISKKIREEGPVDGLLGFSQGGALACMCAALQQKADDERLKNALKFVITIASFSPRSPSWSHIIEKEQPLTLPSLHIAGKKDELHPASVQMAQHVFQGGVLIEHDGGHTIPKLDATKGQQLRHFLMAHMANSLL